MSLVERFVVGVDIQGFSNRLPRHQLLLQRELNRILDDAAEDAGISRSLWERRAEGDGEVAVLSSDIDLLAAVRGFVTELDQRLADHNEDHGPDLRMRLRVAMHIDVLTPGSMGYAGPALTVLQRLLNCAPVRAALTETPEANLAQIISESLYRKTVLPEIGGLRPRQFQQVRVDLPDKGFHQTAYVYVPGGQVRSRPAEPPPSPPQEPHRPPFLVSLTRSPAPRKRPPRDVPPPAVEKPPPPAARPVALSPAVRETVRGLRKALQDNDLEAADMLTTRALLEAAGREHKGSLRAVDGHRLPDALFTEVDSAWAKFSGGVWGFRAQRECIAELPLSGPRQFRRVSVMFGWRDEEEQTVPPYPEFVRRADHSRPFYPTLRNPARERYQEWHDEWASTAMSVHVRLQDWER